MRIFLFGSYATGEATETSDIDVFLTDDNLRGYSGFKLYGDEKHRERLIQRCQPFALEQGGKLDLFIDCQDEFQAVYSGEEQRKLFGKSFLDELQSHIVKIAKEIREEELMEFLSISTHQE
jgi:predicted nucleotidyltransferase